MRHRKLPAIVSVEEVKNGKRNPKHFYSGEKAGFEPKRLRCVEESESLSSRIECCRNDLLRFYDIKNISPIFSGLSNCALRY
jgi:hypothetical protein